MYRFGMWPPWKGEWFGCGLPLYLFALLYTCILLGITVGIMILSLIPSAGYQEDVCIGVCPSPYTPPSPQVLTAGKKQGLIRRLREHKLQWVKSIYSALALAHSPSLSCNWIARFFLPLPPSPCPLPPAPCPSESIPSDCWGFIIFKIMREPWLLERDLIKPWLHFMWPH